MSRHPYIHFFFFCLYCKGLICQGSWNSRALSSAVVGFPDTEKFALDLGEEDFVGFSVIFSSFFGDKIDTLFFWVKKKKGKRNHVSVWFKAIFLSAFVFLFFLSIILLKLM